MRIIRCFAVLLAAVAMAVPAMKAEKLFIHFTDGTQMELDFADRPVITFNSRNGLKIKSNAMGLKTKAFNLVTKITFGDLSGITDAVTADRQICPEASNRVALIGFKTGTRVTVSAVNGVVCRTATVDNEARFELPLDGLAKGVYVIAADHEVCKLVID